MKTLEELTFASTFTEELPGDKETKNSIRQVEDALYSFVSPSLPSSEPYLVGYSKDACDLLGMAGEECKRPEFPLVMSGQAHFGAERGYAHCYGGHQFGTWAGQLGDGRVINLGEVVTDAGQRWEMQLKGVGRTPYSRFADGLAVMRSSIREFVASEAMYHLKVPTSRALCIVGTGQSVLRDMFYNGDAKMEPGAAVCRLAPTFVRFGSFNLPPSRGESQIHLSKKLADWLIKYHFPQYEGSDEKYLEMFREVCESTGKMVAAWQGVGFVHGVMNTDNMSILGLTIDYGPYGFLDKFDPAYTPNITDLRGGGRYAFRNQPEICQWNLVRLATSLVAAGLIEKTDAEEAVGRYAEVMTSSYTETMARKLGLVAYNKELSGELMKNMFEDEADFTNTFRAMSSVTTTPPEGESMDFIPEQLLSAIGGDLSDERKTAWRAWLSDYRAALQKDGLSEKDRMAMQNLTNPKYIPRQHLLQWAIEGAEKGDNSELERLIKVVTAPFDEHEGMEKYCQPPPEDMVKPGVSMLSCSS
ncbi:hypothetical protein BSKO_00686 [Bryopsis sp. KO-2023]|nr:hypothetical protein BSKO_00686 [Bryopsis sp. KO-2023]